MAEPLRVTASQPSDGAARSQPRLSLVPRATVAERSLVRELDENPGSFVVYMAAAFVALAAVVPCARLLARLFNG